jgi:hypothetical protein
LFTDDTAWVYSNISCRIKQQDQITGGAVMKREEKQVMDQNSFAAGAEGAPMNNEELYTTENGETCSADFSEGCMKTDDE